MSGMLRVEYPGAVYHVMCWGNGGLAGTDNCRGDQRRDHGEKRADALIGWALEILSMSEGEILESKGTRPEKQAIVWLVKKNTSVSCVWLAGRLGLGHRVNASRAVSFIEREKNGKIKSPKRKMLQCTG